MATTHPSRRLLLLWIAFSVLAIATSFVSVFAGYRADEIAGMPDGVPALDPRPLSMFAWVVASVTLVVGALALAATLSRSVRARTDILWPVVLMVAGFLGAAVSLVALPLSCAGGVWLVVAVVRHRAAR